MELLTPEPLGDPTDKLQEIPRLRGRECSEGNLDPAIQSEGLPSLGVPVFALCDGEAIRSAMLIEKTTEKLLGSYLIKLLKDFGRA